jgi:CRISPR-associated protein Csy1
MPAPPVARQRGAGDRIRVGFASFFMRKSTVGYYFLSWVRDLPRDVFDVYVYHLHGSDDPVVGQIRESAQVFRNLPRMMPSRVAQVIRDDALDVLIYPELGMDATSFALAAMKLAPVQCAAWGHPVTTGHPAIDVFFSSDAMEPADAQQMYTERLVRLPGIGTRYAMPVAPADGTREKFGLPVGRPLYFCPQSLFKILPDDDALLARVLAAVPEAVLVLCDARSADITRRFRARLDAAIERAGIAPEGRVFSLPTLDHEDYLRANTVCDAMLDTTHWSGGNTSIDAIAAGLPIVTMQGEFMRSRQSAAMLAIIGADELVAHSRDDYVAAAVRIVRDAQWRKTMIGRIADGRHRLFDDPRPVAALAETLRQLCNVTY